jgi:hypothetical protein
MRDIYRRAKAVMVYLGEASQTGGEGIELLKEFDRVSRVIVHPLSPQLWDLVESANNSSKMDSFLTFFNQPWFLRLWVLQEIAVSTLCDPVVIYGQYQLPWSLVIRVANFFQTCIRSNYTVGENGNLIHQACIMDDCRNMTESNAPVTIIQLLHMSYEFKTTDPRDKLFALFGLASDMKDITSRTDFQIDYDKSTSEIYRLFCITHMNFTVPAIFFIL